MKRFWSLFLLLFLSIHVFSQYQQKEEYVLIISSYRYEKEWGTRMAKALRNEINKQYQVKTDIIYAGVGHRSSFYADCYGVQRAFSFPKKTGAGVLVPDLIVFIGEESWMVLQEMDNEEWKQIPAVLCAVRPTVIKEYHDFFRNKDFRQNSFVPIQVQAEEYPVTGVLKNDNELPTLLMMRELLPDLNEVLFLSRDDYQDKYSLYLLENILKDYFSDLKLTTLIANNSSKDFIKGELINLPANTAVLTHSLELPGNIEASVPIFTLRDSQLQGAKIVGGDYTTIKDYVKQTTEVVLNILYNKIPVTSMPFVYAKKEKTVLNREAVDAYGLTDRADLLDNVAYTNIPLSFIDKNYRIVVFGAIGIAFLIFIALLYVRTLYYRKQTLKTLKKYKDIYEEYMAVYENMPLGLALFDSKGTIINHNAYFISFLEEKPEDINLYQLQVLDSQSKKDIQKRQVVDKLFKHNNRYLRFILKSVKEERTNSYNVFMIILDNTEIWLAKEEKEHIYNIFNFAMDASSIGVAEYNLVTGEGIATNAWYENMQQDRGLNFRTRSGNILKEDKDMLRKYWQKAECGEITTFYKNIRVRNGEQIHWIRMFAQVVEYVPQSGKIIVAELLTNIDEQKGRERELHFALSKAQESERLKNAFIANTSSEIRYHVKEIISFSDQMIECVDMDARQQLLKEISEHSEILLHYLTRIIELSKEESQS